MNVKEHFPNLPERISGLGRLAYNLWWSWNPSARQLFRMLDLQSWRESEHNPIRMLTLLPDEILKKIAEDAAFLKRYDAIMECFEQQTTSGQGWFSDTFVETDKTIAYFSAEYGLHSSLPLYAGGLGILAGDYIKECSDLGIPVVAVGLIYSRGYVWQRIAENGMQQDMEKTLDRIHDPILPVLDQDGNQLVVQVPIFDPPVHVTVWKAEVGRVTLYLMETDIDANQPWDRAIAHHLYATNPEQRLRQEIVLGMGGMRVLQTLGIQPSIVHINEGHPALAALERMRSGIENRQSFGDALREIQETTVFTTHTPLPAGTDIFSFQLMEKYFSHYLNQMGIDSKKLLQLGTNPQDTGAGFNMTVFALRTSSYRNAVSKRHGEVARKMWSGIWPEKQENEVPIQAITNGVHLSTWLEPLRFQRLLDKYLGNEWVSKQDQPGFWDKIDQIPDRELWHLHQDMKARLIDEINERARSRW
ncbi:MAG: alpha-glucan family phosphorylase, partial [Calditrichia bacterium]